jgi:PAS domain S-box-containing protein
MSPADKRKRGRVREPSNDSTADRNNLALLQQRLAAVVESSDDAIVSKDLTGIIQTWNPGAERIFGYSAAEMVGSSILRLIPPELHSEEASILDRQRRGERVEHYETQRVTKDGRRIDVSLTVSPIRDASGTVVGASKVARDITARKRAEADLQRSAQELRDESRLLNLLNETGKSIAADLDLEALVQTVIDSTTQLSGAEFVAFLYKVKRDEKESYRLFTMSGPNRESIERTGTPVTEPKFPRAFAKGEPIRISDILPVERSRDWAPPFDLPAGQLRTGSYLAVPVVSRNGGLMGGLYFCHPKPGIFTERIERIITGIAAQASVALDNARLYEDVKRAAEGKEALLEAERSARSEAERVNFMKDEFLATLSHELRTPLNAIVGWAQVLRSRSHADADVLEGLAVIDRNARVQAQLIEDLLDMSRIISGKVRLENQRVDVHDVVRATIAAFQLPAEAKGIDLRVEVAPEVGLVWGDPSRLQQCFWNLISNAIKFTPAGGRVSVSLGQTGNNVSFSVVDTGQGIAPSFLPHIFERFRQADSSSTRYHGGLGLGLSIVKSLVEMHGGTVEASSEGLGNGATFRVTLPVMISTSIGIENAILQESLRSPMGDQPSLKGLAVLVVDDEPDALELLKRVLGDCGAEVFAARSAKAGLEILQKERPDILLSDIGMPDEDGYTLIRQVRALKPRQGGKTPAAAVSAFARPEDRTRALRAGYQMHLAKPIDPTELTAVVASLATRKASSARTRH